MAKETYYKAKETYRHAGIPEECACVKEDPVTCKKRPIDTAKETYALSMTLQVLMNVVIAVLLDNFITSVTHAKELEIEIEEHERSV